MQGAARGREARPLFALARPPPLEEPSRHECHAARSRQNQGLAAIGRVIDPPATAALYAPLHGRRPAPASRIARDIRYGPAERNRLDIFTAEPAGGAAKPVLMFVHGGGFVRGDKQVPGTPFHDNIGAWAARHGLVGVTMTYRLAPRRALAGGP